MFFTNLLLINVNFSPGDFEDEIKFANLYLKIIDLMIKCCALDTYCDLLCFRVILRVLFLFLTQFNQISL